MVKNVGFARSAARRAGRGPTTQQRARAVKRAICSSHSALSEAGQTTSTRAMPLQPAQELAGGDRLHRLAEAHLVGEQRALAEREVQHAFALIGKSGWCNTSKLCSAGLDLGEESARAPSRERSRRSRSSHGVKWRDTRIRRRTPAGATRHDGYRATSSGRVADQ